MWWASECQNSEQLNFTDLVPAVYEIRRFYAIFCFSRILNEATLLGWIYYHWVSRDVDRHFLIVIIPVFTIVNFNGLFSSSEYDRYSASMKL